MPFSHFWVACDWLPIALLAKHLAVPLDYGVRVIGAPPAVGGLLVAAVILSPESLSAVRAALANQMQRAVNILLGGKDGRVAWVVDNITEPIGQLFLRPLLMSVKSGEPGAAAGLMKLRLPAPLTCSDAPVKACAPASRRVLNAISPVLLSVRSAVKV